MADLTESPDPEMLPFEITSDGFGNGTEITINGQSVFNLTSLTYQIDAEGLATLTLVASGAPGHIAGLAGVTVITQEHADA